MLILYQQWLNIQASTTTANACTIFRFCRKPGPEVKNFFMLINSTEHDISTAHKKNKIQISKESFLDFKLSDVVFTMLINVKMPTIVDILTFMSMIHFSLIILVIFI